MYLAKGGALIKIFHVLLKNHFWGFRNASIKFQKTLGKHISLNIGEREEEKEGSPVNEHDLEEDEEKVQQREQCS